MCSSVPFLILPQDPTITSCFKVSHFFNFYFHIFVFAYFIVFFDWIVIMLALTYQLEGMFFFYSFLPQYHFTPCEFFMPASAGDLSLESLNNSKSPQVFRTLLSILADLYNAIVLMVSILPLIFKSSCSLLKPLQTNLRAPTIIGITISFIFYRKE